MMESSKYKKPIFYPKIWLGYSFGNWLEILWEGRFRIELVSIHSFVIITVNSILFRLVPKWIERLIFQRKINNTQVKLAPVFIIGHWRSGTTLLHELLSMDKKLSYPDTYQCFTPDIFLFFRGGLKKLTELFLPKNRPMDSMPMGINRPQEDEFALCLWGAPSPYCGLIFPKQLIEYGRYLRISSLPEHQQNRWKEVLVMFLKKLTLLTDKRIVLKSPTHSFRVAMLSKMFPDARFIYIKRDPYTVYKSTLHMWMVLLSQQGLQTVDPVIVEEYVKNTYIALCEAVEEDKPTVADNRFCEVLYEDLIEKPVETVEKIYAEIDLPGFESVRSDIEQFEKENKVYKTNTYSLSSEEIKELNQIWGKHIEQQGYKLRS